jgi:hypothetical protein
MVLCSFFGVVCWASKDLFVDPTDTRNNGGKPFQQKKRQTELENVRDYLTAGFLKNLFETGKESLSPPTRYMEAQTQSTNRQTRRRHGYRNLIPSFLIPSVGDVPSHDRLVGGGYCGGFSLRGTTRFNLSSIEPMGQCLSRSGSL